MLVEDEPAILELGQLMLESFGYQVLVADSPGAAIWLTTQHSGQIHLLMTDVVMPEMNGWDLAKQLSSLHPNLKCLFMSGYPANLIVRQGTIHANANFIQKPFSLEALAVKVREVLRDLKA